MSENDTNKMVEEAVRGVFTLADSAVGAGRVSPGTEAAFIEKVIAESPIFSQVGDAAGIVNLELTDKRTSFLDTIDLADRVLRPPVAGTEWTGTVAPTVERNTITTQSMILAWDPAWETIEDSIARGDLNTTLNRIYETRFRSDLEDLLFNADTSDVSADKDFLNLWDGLFVKTTEGTSYATKVDTNGSEDFRNVVFPEMIKAIPAKYRDPARLVIMASPDDIDTYNDQWLGRQTPRADEVAEQGLIPRCKGVKVIMSPKIPTGKSFCTLKGNIVIRIQRGITSYTENKPRNTAYWLTMTFRGGIGVRLTEPLVVAYNA